MRIKVMSVFGTRPEAIKMAPLVKELEKNKKFESLVCVTGQHREMLDQVLDIFNIEPNYDLNVMKKNQNLNCLTSTILNEMASVLVKERPDLVLVHGDTTTTFSASLAAFYEKIDIGHVEAGLRTNDIFFPFPEEVNRRLTGVLANFHFAPTDLSKSNLLREGVSESSIYVVGNTVIDSMKYTIKDNYKFKNEILKRLDFNKKTIVVTAHRRENWGQPIENICKAIKNISLLYKNLQFVFLTHLNPIVRNSVCENLSNIDNIHIVDPLDVEDTHNLISRCFFVMSDSGGIQEEAPSVGKYVLVLRNTTERQEILEQGMVRLVGTEQRNIEKVVTEIIDNKFLIKKESSQVYGNGDTAKKICDILENYYLNK